MKRLAVMLGALGASVCAAALAPACGGDAFTAGPADAAAESAPPSDAGADTGGGFCATNGAGHFFCDDFDGRTDPRGSWDSPLLVGKAALSIDGPPSKSPPSSLDAKSTAPGTTDTTFAAVQKKLGRVREVHLSFEIFVEAYGSDPDAGERTAAVALNLALGAGYNVALTLQTAGVATLTETAPGDGGTQSFPRQFAGFGTSRWSRVQLDLVLPTLLDKGQLTLLVDGTKVVSDHLNANPGSGPDTTLLLGLGLINENEPGTWTIRFDNVILDRVLFL